MKYKSLYDTKIIVIDINFYLIEILNLDVVLGIKNIIKKLSASQNVFIVTDNPISYALEITESWGLKSGHIIANAGACTYNIATKTIISTQVIEHEIVKILIKQAIWNNLNFIINTENNQSFIYRLNHWLLNRSKFNMPGIFKLENSVLNTWKNILEIIDNNEIVSVEILFHESNDKKREMKIKKYLDSIVPFCKFNYSIHECTLFVVSHLTSKLISTEVLANQKKINYSDNSIYIAVDQAFKELVDKSYISAIQYRPFIDQNINHLNVHSYEYTKNWIAWLNQHEYLWNEPAESKYRTLFQWIKAVSLKPWEKDGFLLGRYKSLTLNPKYQEIYLSRPTTFSSASWFKHGITQQENKEVNIFVWPEWTEFVFSLLKNKKLTRE